MSISSLTYLPSIPDISAIFLDEVSALGVTSVEQLADGERLFARAALASAELVRPGDALLGGVALRAEGPTMSVHPYTVRQVCTNGAIAAYTTGTEHLERIAVEVETASAAFVGGVEHRLREAIRGCADPAFLEVTVEKMRTAAELEADALIAMLPHLVHVPEDVRLDILASITSHFSMSDDRSALGVVNAVTRIARDRRDPEIRWQLEQIGGELLDHASQRASRRWSAPAQLVSA